MFLTRERAKAKLWLVGRGVLCALALLVLGGQASQSRADMLDWLTNLVQDDEMEHAALSGVTGRERWRSLTTAGSSPSPA